MRLLATESLNPGVILGKTIFNEQGNILLGEGITLTEKMINRLMVLNIRFVYIVDEQTADIIPSEPISDQLRMDTFKAIESVFTQLQSDNKLKTKIVVEKAAARFTELVRNITAELKNNKELFTLLGDLFTYDNEIFSHSLNVTLYSLALGIELKLDEKQLDLLGIGAIFHDIGKMIVPEDILRKPGKLTESEFEQVKNHSEYGFMLLKDIHTISLHVAHCAYQHHERIDGLGYPRGIKGNEIHQLAKIISVADVFDAVTSHRVYRKAMLPSEGVEVLYAGAGSQFEVGIIEAFRRAVAIYPNGLTVQLNDGRKGVISGQNIRLGDRPIVRILEEFNHTLNQTYELNLKNYPQLMIVQCANA
ncbi:HD-GYP domain-containing protein [Peribacillus asahii]|uniref:HD-GYP domain-containing protein n=1 Tax=Peribacillus asahii TaxID=228899 RepID=UPI00380639B4